MAPPFWAAFTVLSWALAVLGCCPSPKAPDLPSLLGGGKEKGNSTGSGNPGTNTPFLTASASLLTHHVVSTIDPVLFEAQFMKTQAHVLRKLQASVYPLHLTSPVMLEYCINALAPDARLALGKS